MFSSALAPALPEKVVETTQSRSSCISKSTNRKLWFGHGFSGDRMHLEHERNYGLGMDSLMIVRTWNTNGIMVWAWMLR